MFPIECPLCRQSDRLEQIDGPIGRAYRMCHHCRLISVTPEHYPDTEDEKSRYLTHKNGITYPGYVKFLKRALDPTLPYLPPKAAGLDYGCGPYPTLSILAGRAGIACRDYDPLFFPELPPGPFDVIFATESVEHFFRPDDEFSTIAGILKRGGILTIMTETWTDPDRFATWYYSKDLTHVCFFHDESIRFLADTFGFEILESYQHRVYILRRI